MTPKITFIIFSIAVLVGCSVSEPSEEKDIKKEIPKENNFPITIEFGSIGWASDPRKIQVTEDSIFVSIGGEVKRTFPSKDSKLKAILDKYSRFDFEGEKYYSAAILDGGYMELSNKYGKRRFDNCFGSNFENVTYLTDTTGLSKYEEIYVNSIDLSINKE